MCPFALHLPRPRGVERMPPSTHRLGIQALRKQQLAHRGASSPVEDPDVAGAVPWAGW